MPRRTNALQKAIKLIEQQKGDYLRLTESDMLRDKDTGVDREVDIVLEGKINQHTILIGIEVRDHKRPADLTWVEQMIKKHECLPTDKLILVSSSGFTRSALGKAAGSRVEAIDTRQGDQKFRSLLKKAAYIRGARVIASVRAWGRIVPINARLRVGKTSITAEGFVNLLFDQPQFKEALFQFGQGLEAEWRDGFSVDGVPSNAGDVLEVLILVDAMLNIPISMTSLSYGDISYVYGEIRGSAPRYFVSSFDGKFFAFEDNT